MSFNGPLPPTPTPRPRLPDLQVSAFGCGKQTSVDNKTSTRLSLKSAQEFGAPFILQRTRTSHHHARWCREMQNGRSDVRSTERRIVCTNIRRTLMARFLLSRQKLHIARIWIYRKTRQGIPATDVYRDACLADKEINIGVGKFNRQRVNRQQFNCQNTFRIRS